MGGDIRSFKVNFTSDGIERLRNEVTEKLKEFMGDYTDDTLVEYVIVLLRNGRTKDEARNELNVFLGDDDSSSFVTWLWDHLSANLNLYVQSDGTCPNEEAKQKSGHTDHGASQGLQNLECGLKRDEVDRIADTKYAARTIHLRSEVGQAHFEDKIQDKPDRTRKSLSPWPSSHRKRNRLDDKHHTERNTVSLATINPSSRLLQSAVREAMGTAGVINKTTAPNSKRLRSVVGTSTVDDSRRRLRSAVSSIAGVALKAAAEAAEDVLRVRRSGNVFDRLGRGVDPVEKIEKNTDFNDIGADEDHEFHDKVPVQPRLNQLRVLKDSRKYETEFTTDMEQERIDEADAMGYRNSILSSTSTATLMDDDSTITRHGIPANACKLKRKYQNQPAAAIQPSYDEYVNAPANANIWKPPPYMSTKEIASHNSSRVIQGGDASDGTSGVQLLNKNSNGLTGLGNGKSSLFYQTELQKTPSKATGSAANVASLEDADARTIFVSNVHFAATKDSLSRHFNKFGQVLKVTIMTDAATGQPKGSCYVEFMQKEIAEQATSLDGTSFMSRIIKVCMKGSAQPEATTPTTTSFPRAVFRGSVYPVPRFSRAPFPRGNPSSFRGRYIARPVARSLQWKREAQPMPATVDATCVTPGNNASPPVRSLTYVRPELKAEGALHMISSFPLGHENKYDP
ncbi:unnamed protein product [Rhodiola kirilowii]